VVIPFPVQNLWWLLRSVKTNGIVRFTGKEYSGQMTHEYAVVTFKTGTQTIWFNGYDNVLFPRRQVIPVLYQPNNPADARIDVFVAIWADTLVYACIPAVILMVLFLHPAIIPRQSKIRLMAKRPFIRLV
jgi:hypothetical protein